MSPTKIPSTQAKTLSTINETLITQRKNQVRQKNYQERQPKIYAVLPRGNFCREFTNFFGVFFCRPKNLVAYQKGQISGMPKPCDIQHFQIRDKTA